MANPKNERGIAVYSASELLAMNAKGKDGRMHRVTVEQKWTQLDPVTAIMVYQKCAPVFAVISGRANRISSLEWHVENITREEDKIAEELKSYNELFQESNIASPIFAGRRLKLLSAAREHLPDLFPDFSNFRAALYRWSKRLKNIQANKANEIEDFFSQPSPGELWPDFIKKYTQDLLVHGRVAIYKKVGEDGLVNNILVMPGGSVVQIKDKYLEGGVHGYIQLTDGTQEPQLFWSDEVSYGSYLPNSATVWGLTPIDSLINLVSENLLFNELMARKADGSEPPEKVVVYGRKDPAMGDFADDLADMDPDDPEEQRRIENKLNRIKREAGIATLTGVGTPVVLDLSRADTLPTQLSRQDQINKYVAMVYNASNMEINETGGDGTSGRSTSEAQERSENAKGVRPILRIAEEQFSREIIPFRFGYGYRLRFETSMSDSEKADLAVKMAQSTVLSKNEIREKVWNLDPAIGAQYDELMDSQPAQTQDDFANSIAAKMGI